MTATSVSTTNTIPKSGFLERFFKLKQHGTNVKTEVIAGITTFLTMSYIIFVNPSMLAQTGMDQGAVFVATCLAAALGCFIMGLLANYPVALAPGMGLNAFFTYTVVFQMGYSWQVALGAVFLSGILFVALSVFKVRELFINAIPHSLRVGIGAGIGIFLALIALQNAKVIVDNPATLVGMGDFTQFGPAMAALSLFITIGLVNLGFKSAVMVSILVVTAIAVLTGNAEFNGIMSMPPSIAPTFMQMDLAGAFNVSMVTVIFSLLFVDLFDTAGTLIAVGSKAELLDEEGKLPKAGRAMLADSTATAVGAVLGTSSTTSFVESASGASVGGRTGLTAVVVGMLFLLSLFFSPLAGIVPAYATTGALLYVSVLMMSSLVAIDWKDLTEATPVVIACLLMPLTYSIAHGIGLGFISYCVVKILSGNFKQVNIAVWIISAIFLLKFTL